MTITTGRQVLVSRQLWWHLCCPTLEELCSARDTFWRLQLDERLDGCIRITNWWRLATEAETVVAHYHDYSI